MDIEKLKVAKCRCLLDLRHYLPHVEKQLCDIDSRLWAYVSDAVADIPQELSVTDAVDGLTSIPDCVANLYELLGIRKVLRLMTSYPIDIPKFYQWLMSQEGEWDGGVWVSGGLMFDTPRGARHVRLMPYQVWCTFGMTAIAHDVRMREYVDGDDLLPSERVVEEPGGVRYVYDRRRLCTESHCFQTRKSGKTEYGVSLAFAEFVFIGDSNSQVSIVANSLDQAKNISFRAARNFAYQIDPAAVNRLGGKFLKVNKTDMVFRDGQRRTASLTAYAAGGKPRDGYNSEWILADEHGQARYVNGHSDMEDTVQVLVGSAGVRRERMLHHTTTAGKVTEGPYKHKLEQVQELLLLELDIPLGESRQTAEDYWFALLLKTDPWDYDGTIDSLDYDYIFRRVNRAIGMTVQPNWYKERLHIARSGSDDEREEVLTKDFNMWRTSRIVDWIQPFEIRRLQNSMRIDSCTYDTGWMVSVGMDFSVNHDLYALSYLAFRSGERGSDEFFADMDAWITEDTLSNSSISKLLMLWSSTGHLHVCPGKVIEPAIMINRIIELYDSGIYFLGFGYDNNRAKMPINALMQWLADISDVNTAQSMMIPVSQTRASYNPQVEELEYMIRSERPLISFSDNPLWPYEFGTCSLDIDVTMENKKPVKMTAGSDACLVDNIQALCNALHVIDFLEGKKSKD